MEEPISQAAEDPYEQLQSVIGLHRHTLIIVSSNLLNTIQDGSKITWPLYQTKLIKEFSQEFLTGLSIIQDSASFKMKDLENGKL